MEEKRPIIGDTAGGLEFLAIGNYAHRSVHSVGVALRAGRAGVIDSASKGEEGKLAGLAKVNHGCRGGAGETDDGGHGGAEGQREAGETVIIVHGMDGALSYNFHNCHFCLSKSMTIFVPIVKISPKNFVLASY
jgi:hypothetical protein